ncbi:MAG: adenosine deaminase [Paracrocinitomix sp.]|jgi:adenosine deaminase
MALDSASQTAAPNSPLRLMPKVELHCHVEGAARAQTVADLAALHQIDIGVDDPSDLYEYESLADFLAAFGTVCSVLQTPQDFHRLAYEAAEDGANAGIRYREMFFSPGFHLERGIPFDVMWQGLAAGVAEGETDFGVRTRLILDVDKPKGLGPAMALLEVARGLDRDLLIGIGGDSTERGIDHRLFAPLMAEAHNIGLKTCFHCGEDGPADNIRHMVDAGIDRIDHGTRLLEDPELARQVIDEQIPLTSCPSSNMALGIVDSLADHPFAAQREAGALVTLNSDDPTFFQFDLADEYQRIAATFGFDHDAMIAINDAAITASWLDDSDKAALRADFSNPTLTS